jgi:transcriptional regulator with XRE-family HTH domain
MLMTIGEKITFFRKRKGFSQEQVAELLEMSPQGYGKIERDETDVNYSRLELICKVLQTSIQDLVGYAEVPTYANSNHNSYVGKNGSYQNIIGNEKLAFENEKLKVENEALRKEIAYQKEIIDLMRKEK